MNCRICNNGLELCEFHLQHYNSEKDYLKLYKLAVETKLKNIENCNADGANFLTSLVTDMSSNILKIEEKLSLIYEN
jgi:hypothetical protein